MQTLEVRLEALLTAIVVWLSVNFSLPANFDHPQIKLVPATEMANLRYNVLFPPQQRKAANDDDRAAQMKKLRPIVAVYDNRNKIIFIQNNWTGRTPADLSIIVHEMVHHLQHAAGLKYDCPSGREKLAYQAQDKWLAQFGRSLESEFKIDRLTMMVTTSCAFALFDPP